MSAPVVTEREKDLTRYAFAINQIGQGRSNATGTTLLTANATSTVVTAANCGPNSVVFLSPLTANARTAMNNAYISSVRAGSFTITHASNAAIDQSFGFACFG